MKDYKILLKNNYLYNRENSLINILQYLIVEKEGKKYLLLQLNNNFKYSLNSFEMLVVQLDEKGNSICTSKFECKDINVRSGKTFIPEVFVELDEKCKDIKADLIEAKFNKYIYQNDRINRVIDKKKKPVSISNEKLIILKKKIKRPKFLLIPVLVLFLLAAVCSFIGVKMYSYKKYTFTLEDYEYSFVGADNSKDADIIITKYNGNDKNIAIPDKLMEHDIVAIGKEAFANNKNISKVKFEGDIKEIGKSAFKSCSNLLEINLNDIEIIKSSAFEACSKLEKVVLKKITILESKAFKDCVSLKTVNIQNDEGKAKLEDSIFYNCTSLSEVEINLESTSGYKNLLASCSKIENLKMKSLSANGRTYTLHELFSSAGAGLKLRTLYIENIDDIPAKFADSLQLEEITIKTIKSNKISEYAFNNCANLSTINIPNTITEIGKCAFARTKIKSINFPKLERIEESAFSNCTALIEINLSDTTTYLGDKAFEYCSSLKTIKLPDTVTYIGEHLFKACLGLTELTSPYIGSDSHNYKDLTYMFSSIRGLSLKKITLTKQNIISEHMFEASAIEEVNMYEATEILYSAFKDCLYISVINLPKVTKINESAFENCVSLQIANFSSDLTEIYSKAFLNCSKLTQLSDTSKVYILGQNAFENCSSLEKIDISSLKVISSSLFKKCVKLKSITYSKELTEIQSYAFEGCIAMDFEFPNTLQKIGDYAFKDCVQITSFVIEDNVLYIGKGIFNGCTLLSKITTPFIGQNIAALEPIEYFYQDGSQKNITELTLTLQNVLSDYAFQNSNKLTNIIMPNVVQIGDYAFQNCTSIKSFVLSDQLTDVGDYIFSNCTALEKVTLPNTITYISNGMFENCVSLKEIEISQNILTIGEYAFYNCSSLQRINLHNGITTIGKYAFASCDNISSMTIPNEVQYIGVAIFSDCKNLKELKIPFVGEYNGNLKKMDYLFSELSQTSTESTLNLTEITLTVQDVILDRMFENSFIEVLNMSNVVSVGEYAFNNCIKLRKIPSLTNLTEIYPYTFAYCSSLQTIDVPNVTLIEDSAFVGCSSLKLISLLEQVTTIGKAAFSGCSSLESLSIPNVETLGEEALYNCSSLKNISSLNKLTEIKNQTFRYCRNITNVNIPNVTVIGDYAFGDCSKIKDLYLSSELSTLGEASFLNCTSLNSFTIPNDILSVGKSLLKGCTSLVKLETPFIGKSIDDVQAISYIFGVSVPTSLTEIVVNDQEEFVAYSFANTSLNTITTPKASSFGAYIFNNCTNLETYSIPVTVTSIGNCAFLGCTSLNELTIGDQVTNIGINIISGCNALAKLTIPFLGEDLDNVNTINYLYGNNNLKDLSEVHITLQENFVSSTFLNSTLSKITLDNALTLESNTFKNCENLSEVNLGSRLTEVNGLLFVNCTSLSEVEFPDTVTKINSDVFQNCPELKKLKIPFIGSDIDNLYSLSYLFYWSSNNIEELEITKQTVVSNYQFNNAQSLKKVKLSSVQSIYDYAFSSCYNLESIDLGDELTSIGYYAFSDCSSLKEIVIPDTVTYMNYGIFSGCSSLTELTTPFVGYSIDNLYSTSSLYSWSESKLTDLTVTKQTYVSSSQFQNLMYLERVSMPAVTNIHSSSFRQCVMLEEVEFSEDLSSINEFAFYGCNSLLKFVINEDVTNISDSAFYGCTSLYEVYDYSSLDIIAGDTNNGYVGYYAFHIYDSPSDEAIPKIITDNYLLALKNDQWYLVALRNKKEETYELPSGLTYNDEEITYALIDSLFANNKYVKSVVIPSCVTSIGSNTFEQCTLLETVDFASDINIESIGNNSFYYCEKLKDISIPNSVKTIGYNAFYRCLSIKEVVLNENIESIEFSAFENCKSLYEVFNLSNLEIEKNSTNNGFVAYYALAVYDALDSERISIEEIDGLKYVAVDDELLVLGVVDDSKTKSIVFPDSVEHNGVVYDTYKIYKNAFYENMSLESVELSDSITEIGDYAFYNCQYITDIKMSNNLEKIGQYAFYNCYQAEGMNISEKVEIIGNYAFYNNSRIKSFTIHKNLKEIGDNAFSNCSNLKYIINGDNEKLEYIGSYAFYYCRSLVFAEIGGVITEVNDGTFHVCTSLESIVLPDTVTRIKGSAFNECNSLNYFVVGEKVQEIEYSAFNYCYNLSHVYNLSNLLIEPNSYKNGRVGYYATNIYTNLDEYKAPALFEIDDYMFYFNGEELTMNEYHGDAEEIVLPSDISYNNVTFDTYRLGEYLFQNSPIKSIYIPNNVSKISDCTFQYCGSLKTVTFEENSVLKEIGDYAFYDCYYLEEIFIPASVVSIEAYAFANTRGIGNIQFEEGSQLEYIRSYAFYDSFSNVENVKVSIPASVKEIGEYAFYSCDYIGELTFEENSKLERIGSYAFSSISYLGDIKLPANLSSIPYSAFAYSGITSLSFEENSKLETIESEAFFACYGLAKVEFPASLKAINMSAFSSCNSLKEIVFAENSSLETICVQAFYNTAIEKLELPASLITIESEAFAYSSLKELSFEEGSVIETINEKVFSSNASLEKIDFPASLKTIGNSAFECCYNIKEINFEENSSLEKICSYAFLNAGINTLFDLVLPENLNDIEDYAFISSGLKNVKLPSSLLSIGEYAFADCVYLEKIEFEEESQLEIIKSYAFNNSGAFEKFSIELPSSVKTIEAHAFAYSNLSTINLPASLISLGEYAFEYCYNLSEVKADDNCSLKVISNCAFIMSGPSSGMSVTLPSGLTEIGNNAFNYANIIEINIPATVNRICGSAFYYASKLNKITFEDNSNLKTIENNAFRNTNLTELVIPSSVETIEAYAFANNRSLSNLVFEDGSKLKELNEGVFLNSLISQLEVPSNIETIKSQAFSSNTNLNRVVLNSKLKTIESSAFENCNNIYIIFKNGCNIDLIPGSSDNGSLALNAKIIKEGALESGVNYVLKVSGNYRFIIEEAEEQIAYLINYNSMNDSNSIVIPEIIELDDNEINSIIICPFAFDANDNISEIHISKLVKEIGDSAFNNLVNLNKIYFDGTKEDWEQIKTNDDNYDSYTIVFEEEVAEVKFESTEDSTKDSNNIKKESVEL